MECKNLRLLIDTRLVTLAILDVEKRREYHRNWLRLRRKSFFDGKFCVNCNSTENLELDHIDPNTKVSHNIWSWSKERREEEIAKCQVLCKTCHLNKTIEQSLRKPITHGNSGYDRMCRCEVCKSAHSIRMQGRNRKVK